MRANAAAVTLLLSGNQAALSRLARKVKSIVTNHLACPGCGNMGPHQDNGSTVELSYCCADCGEHFDAEEV